MNNTCLAWEVRDVLLGRNYGVIVTLLRHGCASASLQPSIICTVGVYASYRLSLLLGKGYITLIVKKDCQDISLWGLNRQQVLLVLDSGVEGGALRAVGHEVKHSVENASSSVSLGGVKPKLN